MRAAGQALTWIAATVLLLGLVMTIWVCVTGLLAYQHMSRVQSEVEDTITAMGADPASATSKLSSLAHDASEARSLTSGPVWELASLAPWVGPQLAAIHTLTVSADGLLSQSFMPLAEAAQTISTESLRPNGGRLDPAALSGLVEPARAAVEPAKGAADAVEGIDRTPLLGVLAVAVDKAGGVLRQSATFIDALSRTSQLLPSMLGRGDERSYLVLVENNAEWRSLGGISGSAFVLKTKDGVITLGAMESATALSQNLTQPIVTLPPEIINIYGQRPARFFHNLTEIPDFSIVGPLAKDFFAQTTGVHVDGVIAIDPVVLSYILRATGPVKLPDGEQLSADNAAGLLMNGVYERYPGPIEQDAFFAAATGAVFEAIIDGRGSAAGFVSALSRAGSEHRLLMWSAIPVEQSILAGTTIAGPLPATDERTARFGVYLNDGTGSKMSYYLTPKTSLAWGSCPSADRSVQRQLRLHLDLVSSAPSDAATSLPVYITGNGVYGVAPGTARVVGNIYLPSGFDLVSAETTFGTNFEQATFDGYTVLTFGVDVDPQQSVGIDVLVQAPSQATGAEAYVTPTAEATLHPVTQATCQSPAHASLG